MAVTLDTTLGTGAAAGSATITLTTTNPVAAGGTIIAIIGRFNSAAPTATLSVTTTGGLTWTQDHTLTSGNIRTSLFRAHAPAGLAASTAIVWTQSAATGDLMVGAGSFLGVDTSGPTAFNGASSLTTAWTSTSVAAASGNFLVGGSFGDGFVGSSTPTGPAVELFDVNSAGQSEMITAAYKLSVAGSDLIAGTWSGTLDSATVAVAYAAAAAASLVIPRPPLRALIGR